MVYVFTDTKVKVPEYISSNIIISKCYKKWNRIFFPLKHNKALNDIQNVIDITAYDIMHAHSLFSNGYLAYKLFLKRNIPYIVAVRNTDVNVFFKFMPHLRNLGISILQNASRVIFISESYKEQVIEKYISKELKDGIREKSIVIPNGIDEYWLNNKNILHHKNIHDPIRLIYVGTVDKNKNIETTIKASKKLLISGFNVSYKIIGKIQNNKYRFKIKKNKFISYVANSPKEDILPLYRESDIFIMPSKHETFGLVYAEAMSQGLPVIYTRNQGFDKNFPEGEVGFPVKYNDPNEIIEKIHLIINNYSMISQNCIQRVNRFDWNAIAKEYMDIYKRVISIQA